MGSILSDFDENKDRYESFAKSIRSLLSSLILNEGIKIHSISSRVKLRDSLEKKIDDKGTYNEISDITDIVGLRVITHFADDVDLIAEVIESEFQVDRPNSIDKRATLEPDRFGYLSLHYVVELDKNRKKLKEHNLYKDFKAEIQIRSILQHTWAEIEHDIGYKSAIDIPTLITRQFSRLAGLLELADSEFINIKKSLADYKTEVAEVIENNPNNQSINLDRVSYIEYLKASPLINSIFRRVKEETNIEFTVNQSTINPIKQLHYFNITTIKDLDDAFSRFESKVFSRALEISKDLDKKVYPKFPGEVLGIYLAQALATDGNDLDKIKKYIEVNKIRPKDKIEDFASKLLNTFISFT